ncbi:hypothetical protein WSK_4233 [Novosphingobium sp. Rr 2-17]|uniref:hypothetical protein n=1 Tax=Novosphingobium sp. Rr 2-17 TaxID=555793 RepID=UPI000269A8A7|nr:hypothetical protein [Novosphingobium sp. Rr 2-17]EIZ77240.1 hypothetical protein WSK_4233 [Novosphingobium sp. Rr 2-17]
MKANPRRFGRSPAPSLFLAPLAATLALAACVAPPANTPQQPVRTPAARPPAPQSRPAMPPPVAPMPSNDWRDVPATPGTWRLIDSPAGASASFANGLLTIRCERAANTVTLVRADNAAPTPGNPATASVRITTSDVVRTLSATRAAGTVRVALPARDSMLDSIAFSRGRFMLEAAGAQPLYVPSWTEISRVVEDCR